MNKKIEIKDIVTENLEDSKAQDIVSIDLHGKSDICDYMIIASGTSDRHVKSIADKLCFDLKHNETINIDYRVEGMDEGNWIVLDLNTIVVHIFKPETRELYDIESLWSESKKILKK